MCKFKILIADDLSYATLRVENVLVKNYRYEDDIVNELFKRFKADNPSKIEFGSWNKITWLLRDMIFENGYNIDENGILKSNMTKLLCYNTLEKEATEMVDTYTLKFKSKENLNIVITVLLEEGYQFSLKSKNEEYLITIN